MPSVSTSAADLPPARPSATSAAPWAACLATVAKPVSTCTDAPAGIPVSRRASSSRTPATPATRPDRMTSRAAGRRDGKKRDRFDDTLEIRLTGEPIARCPWVRDRCGRRIRRASDGCDASGKQQAFRDRSDEKRDLSVQRSRATETERPRRSTGAVNDPSILDGDRRREGASQFELNEGDIPLAAAESLGLIVDRQRDGAHLIGGPHVDAVHLSVGRHRREVYDSRREGDWQGGAREHPHQRPEASDAA